MSNLEIIRLDKVIIEMMKVSGRTFADQRIAANGLLNVVNNHLKKHLPVLPHSQDEPNASFSSIKETE